jgi:hypothetical protein
MGVWHTWTTKVADFTKRDPDRSAAKVRLADDFVLPVQKARGLCAGTFSASAVCLVYGASSALSSSAFRSFVVPAGVGALLGVMILGLLFAREEPKERRDVPGILGALGTVVFVVATLVRFLLPLERSGWWSVAGGALLMLGLATLAELLKLGGAEMSDHSSKGAPINPDA